MDEQAVEEFWQTHACGDAQVGGLRDRFHGDYDKFFTDYDRFRYWNERHLPGCIDALSVAGKQVLEIGLGEGADSERMIRQGSVLDLPFADNTFDMVFSHGVLHLVPDIKQAQGEIHRILRPSGELVI